MNWHKKGLLLAIDQRTPLMHTHASQPFAESLDSNTLRIWFSSRDTQGRSRPFTCLATVCVNGELQLQDVQDKPMLDLGSFGTFDDNGVMPFWIVEHFGTRYFYFIGWNASVKVPYRVAIGLAISHDGGATYERVSQGPILDRCVEEPFFVSAPCVLFHDGLWRMWYQSCSGWDMIDTRAESRYRIKYAESKDGIHWNLTGKICIDYGPDTEAITRPSVLFENGIFRMWYSYRCIDGYRTNPDKAYRLGYAESNDGIIWTRKDNEIGIGRSETGWDSQMICYSHVFQHNGRQYMLYNGNGFGQSGLGYAMGEGE